MAYTPTVEKPLIRRLPAGLWECGCRDGKGRWVAATGLTKEEAHENWKTFIARLEKCGLRWEVFP